MLASTYEAQVHTKLPKTSFPHYWKACVGSGHALLATRADFQKHLRIVREQLGMEGIRFHGIFDDDMSVVSGRDSKGKLILNFYNIDQVFDYIVKDLGMKPVVELSFMPSTLVDPKDVVIKNFAYKSRGGYKGLLLPPVHWDDWYVLVKNTTLHFVERYGLAEVLQWKFEVWNELRGMDYPHPYLTMFSTSWKALKSVHSELKVGGPATASLNLTDGTFYRDAKLQGTPPDFISSHFYPSDPQCDKRKIDCFAELVNAANDAVQTSGIPFYMTEFNEGHSMPFLHHRDRSSAAAFLFRNIPLLSNLQMLSWWTFSDIFEETWMLGTPFYNGFGLLTKQGVPKPIFRAFELLNSAGHERVNVSTSESADSTVSVWALASQDDVRIFVSNYIFYGNKTEIKNEDVIITLDVQPAEVTAWYFIDTPQTNAFDLYQTWGSPSSLTDVQIAELKAASEVKTSVLNTTDGIIKLSLEPFTAVCLSAVL